MGTLHVVGAPAGDPNDLTRRALRILRKAVLIISDGEGKAGQLLDHYGIATPLAPAPQDAHLDALQQGDVALLCSGIFPAPSADGCRLIRGALDRGWSVVPAPGPSLPITALVVSGLPADSFVCLGELPEEQNSRRELLTAVSTEHRTILVLASSAFLDAALVDLHGTLGDRPLALVTSSERGAEVVWRGMCAEAAGALSDISVLGTAVLVIGGAPDGATRWDEDRLRDEIQSRRTAGLGAKEISQELAEDSGWARREIYRMSVELAQQDRTQRGELNAT